MNTTILHCNNCRKDVIVDVDLSIESVLNTGAFSVEVGIDVNCQECGSTIIVLGGIIT